MAQGKSAKITDALTTTTTTCLPSLGYRFCRYHLRCHCFEDTLVFLQIHIALMTIQNKYECIIRSNYNSVAHSLVPIPRSPIRFFGSSSVCWRCHSGGGGGDMTVYLCLCSVY